MKRYRARLVGGEQRLDRGACCSRACCSRAGATPTLKGVVLGGAAETGSGSGSSPRSHPVASTAAINTARVITRGLMRVARLLIGPCNAQQRTRSRKPARSRHTGGAPIRRALGRCAHPLVIARTLAEGSVRSRICRPRSTARHPPPDPHIEVSVTLPRGSVMKAEPPPVSAQVMPRQRWERYTATRCEALRRAAGGVDG